MLIPKNTLDAEKETGTQWHLQQVVPRLSRVL